MRNWDRLAAVGDSFTDKIKVLRMMMQQLLASKQAHGGYVASQRMAESPCRDESISFGRGRSIPQLQ